MRYPKAILLTILYVLSKEIIGLWILLFPSVSNYPIIYKIYQLVNSIALLTLLIFVLKLLRRPDLLKINKSQTKYYVLAVILGIGFVFFQPILNIIYNVEFSSEAFHFNFDPQRLISFNVIALGVLFPITEEMFFRNYLQRELTKEYNPLLGIIIASVLFAFIHIPYQSLFVEFIDFSLHRPFITLFGGVILGILFYNSKSIIPSIIFHIIWNFTSYII